MSTLIGMNGGSSNIFGTYASLASNDERNMPQYHQWGFCTMRMTQSSFGDGVLWTNSRGLGGQLSGSVSGDASTASGTFELYPGFDEMGGQQIKKIIGMTFDFGNNALGNCLVQGFLSSNNTFVGQTTSDAGGYYELTTAFTGMHYVVAYKIINGVPDQGGSSLNTLIPL